MNDPLWEYAFVAPSILWITKDESLQAQPVSAAFLHLTLTLKIHKIFY